MNVTIVDPLAHQNWDDLLAHMEHSCFYHSAGWARVIHETYEYKALYFTASSEGRIVGLIPIMEVRSLLTGNRGVSLPFTDTCKLLAESPDVLQALLDNVIAYGRSALWNYVEFRDDSRSISHSTPSAPIYVHLINLGKDEDALLRSFRDSTRRNIRKAEREGTKVSFSDSLSAVETYFALHCETRRMHGLPPQPWLFFKKLHEHVISHGKGFVALASHQGTCVAGAVYLFWKNQAIYKFGASKRNNQHLRSNNLIMWEAISHFRRNGFISLHLGKTECDHCGLLQFKRGWHPEEGTLHYHKINLKRTSPYLKYSSFGMFSPIVKKLPLPALRLVGNLLYKHIG